MTRVWIAYEPRVFREALVAAIQQQAGIEIVEDAKEGVDIGVFRLGITGELQDFFRHAPFPEAKLVVLSPKGDKAFIRYPGERSWTTIQPFSMPQLLLEIAHPD